MFESLAEYPRIVVSGPHRSGTTICATMIAHDTGLRLVREEEFSFTNEAQFNEQLAQRGVIQAPFMAHLLHTLPPDVLVVFMFRGPIEIIRSQRRMIDAEGNVTGGGISKYRAHQFHADGRDVKAIYETWEEQKRRIPSWREVFYKNLREHPLWQPARSHFTHRQTG